VSSSKLTRPASDELVRLCHDLRQYVAAGMLLTQMPGTGEADPQANGRLEMIGQLFRHIRDLIADDVDTESRMCRFDLVALTEECVELTRLKRKVSLRNLGVDPHLIVFADPVMMRRAIGNVLDNASRAAGPNDTILVTLGCDGTHGYVEVSDEGPGFGSIPSQSGHGLSVVEAALRDCHGRLEISSGPGAGTDVRLLVPTIAWQVAE
jgi:signal transduction histidine kinase